MITTAGEVQARRHAGALLVGQDHLGQPKWAWDANRDVWKQIEAYAYIRGLHAWKLSMVM